MLSSLDVDSLETLLAKTVPESIRQSTPMTLPEAHSEAHTVRDLRQRMQQNRVCRNYLGMGYTDCVTPPVIQRGVLENPGWYTQYTPYQAEISQGRLEVLFYFQTLVSDLTGMDIANASLLDEATAAAEGMAMAYSLKGNSTRNRLLILNACHPQTEAVLRTRAAALGIQVETQSLDAPIDWDNCFASLTQFADTHGQFADLKSAIEATHDAGGLAIVATDLLPLTLTTPPGDFGADIVVGSSQPMGVPLGYGGPHAGFFATRDKFKRKIPGRVVGLSKDSQGGIAYRLALQTREQHIRREKATSNICTAQALLANMAALFAMYHGPSGLKQIAQNIHRRARQLDLALQSNGYITQSSPYFDTLSVNLDASQKKAVVAASKRAGINLRHEDIEGIGITLDETVSDSDVADLIRVFSPAGETATDVDLPQPPEPEALAGLPARTRPYLTHPAFHSYQSETEMMRFIKRQENKDLSLTASMIPLGSCTMKLNAAMEMQALSWPEVSAMHPFCPPDQAQGYQAIFSELESWLATITGLDAVSLQPNAGSQGEYAGLLAIKRYHEAQSESQSRTVCLIPRSAHGTNPASAVMAGFRVVPVDCDEAGNIDLKHLEQLAEAHAEELGALMITYPSTHGVFEEQVCEATALIHKHGGQVYLDGANLNAQVGLTSPGAVGADVCHLNLHKTFCIPHGGGGPGVGPIAVRAHLAPYLPGHPSVASLKERAIGPIAAAPWGSASILTISWAYIYAMGAPGLTLATAVAILNANYIAHRLAPYYPVLYRGRHGFVAHECIIDLRAFQIVTVEDVAKRLMDYGFHAPTISWPVAGTMMIEPTESESKAELDRFCEAMIQIHAEIQAVESGKVDAQDNLLKNAPHTAAMSTAEPWSHPYSRNDAAFPVESLKTNKFWPAVGRIDNVYGDRNPICTCEGMEAFENK